MSMINNEGYYETLDYKWLEKIVMQHVKVGKYAAF